MLSKTSIYLIRALVELANLPVDTYIGTAAIAKKINSPQNYLGKTLKTLIRFNILLSQKGHGGGFRLKKDPHTIFLLDVVEPIEHIKQKPHCIMGQNLCSEDAPCALHQQWKSIRQSQIQFLSNTSIADIQAYYQKKEFKNGLCGKI